MKTFKEHLLEGKKDAAIEKILNKHKKELASFDKNHSFDSLKGTSALYTDLVDYYKSVGIQLPSKKNEWINIDFISQKLIKYLKSR